jgi:[ribosomal protein S5]-alanine N-acetyltransferase
MEASPRLYTNRLILRKIEIEDVPSLVKHANNKKISDNIINIPYPYQEPDAVFRIAYVVRGFKNKERYVFAIVLKETEEFIGEISLHLDSKTVAQLGYWLGEPFWNRGITTEAIEAVLKFGFEQLNLHRIYATCHQDNTASYKVLLKNGMTADNTNGNVTRYSINQPQYELIATRSQTL